MKGNRTHSDDEFNRFKASLRARTPNSTYNNSVFSDAELKSNLNYSLPQPDVDSDGFWKRAGTAILRTAVQLGNDVANSGRTWTKKLIDGFIDSDLKRIDDYTQALNDIDLILEYKQKKKELAEYENRKVGSQFENYYDLKIQELRNRIAELDSFFLGEGRTRDAIAKEMYDVNLLDWKDNARLVDKFISKGYGSYTSDSSILGGAKNVGTFLGNVLSTVENATDFVLSAPAQLLSGNNWHEYVLSEVIKDGKLDSNDPADKALLEKLYKGVGKGYENINTERLNEWKEENDRELKENIAELGSDLQFAKDGKLFGVLDIYDPEDIPELFKKAQENFGQNWYDYFLHPYNALMYGAPETASTVGLFKYQAYAMGVDGMLAWLSKKLPTWAARGGVGGIAATVAKGVVDSNAARAGIAGLNFAAARLSRQEETGMEAMQAMSERVSKELKEADVSEIAKVENTIKERGEKMGFDMSDMDLDKTLKFGIAFNINTGVEGYDNAKVEARKGINKLINANNSLAIMDYLEVLPFLSYSGRVMRDWAKKSVALAYGNKFVQNATEESSKPWLQAASDFITKKAVKKFIEKGDYAKALATKHIGRNVVKGAALSAREASLEGLEEGVQEILQNRYQRGVYDDYEGGQNVFDVSEVFDDARVAAEAIAAYWGVNIWDSELPIQQIRKAMNTGAFSSFLFSKALGGARNIWSDDADGTVRQLYNQIKSDRTLNRLISEQYGKREDQKHIELFVQAFDRGLTNRQLRRSLADLRESVDENNTLVRKSYLDEDIRMMENAWNMYTNQNILDAIKANNIEKYGEFHKALIVEGAARITAQQKTLQQLNDDQREIKSVEYRHNDIVSEILDPEISDERRKELQDEYPELFNMVSKLTDHYLKYLEVDKKRRSAKFASFVARHNTLDKFFENRSVKEYLGQHGELDEPLYNVAQRVFADKTQKNAALRYAYDAEAKADFAKRLDSFDAFKNNRHVRSVVRKFSDNERRLNLSLKEAYDDKARRLEVIDRAFQQYNGGTYTLEDFIQERVHIKHRMDKLNRIKEALKQAKDANERNKTIRAMQGLDVDTDMEGIVDYLDDIVKQQEERQKKDLARLGNNATYEMLFGDLDIRFDDQEEYDKLVSRVYVNSAVYGNQSIISNAFLMGQESPTALSTAIYGRESSENQLSDIVKLFREILGRLNQRYERDEQVEIDENADEHDRLELSKNAAWQIIKDLVDKKIQRRRIANREFEEEGPSTPLTEEHEATQRQTEEEKAKEEAPAEELQSDSEKKPTNVDEASMSDAERRARKRAGMDTTTREERVKKRLELRAKQTENKDDEKSTESPQPAELPQTGELTQPEGTQVEQAQTGSTLTIERGKYGTESGTGLQPALGGQDAEEAPAVSDSSDDVIPTETDPEDIASTTGPTDDDLELEQEEEPTLENDPNDYELEYDNNEYMLEFGWVDILDYDLLDINEDGVITYDDMPLPEDQQKAVMDDLILLDMADNPNFDLNHLPEGNNSVDDKKRDGVNESVSDLISQTLFYQPNPKTLESGEDELPWNGNPPVELPKKIGSGRELAKKLTTPGWLQKAKKYYIVTQSQQSKNILPGADIRDTMTVAMVIEDDEKCYVTFLRDLGTTFSETGEDGRTIPVNAEEHWENWLLSRHVDWRKVVDIAGDEYSINSQNGGIYKRGNKEPLTSSQKVKLYKRVIFDVATDLARHLYYVNNQTYEGFERFWTKDPVKENYRTVEEYKKALSERRRLRKLITERARQTLALPGKRLLTEELIKAQISALRTFRNSIIDLYLTTTTENEKTTYVFPKKANTSVVPVSVQQSNGKITKVKENYNPVYRTVGSDNLSIDDILQLIESGDLEFGYGLGMFAHQEDRWAIRGLLEKDATTTHKYGKTLTNRSGLSGKIYWLVKSLTGSSKPLPIMLAEEKFDTQVRVVRGKLLTVWLNNPKNLVLCLKRNPQTGMLENVNTEGYLPSAAEVIFYILTQQINSKNGEFTPAQLAEISEFFIHSGEKTLLKNQPKSGSDPFGQLRKKQLFLGQDETTGGSVLSIALPEQMQTEDGKTKTVYVLREFDVQKLMLDTKEAEDDRRSIIQAIATQMHWNTDLSHMNDSINVMATSPSPVSAFFRWAINNFAETVESNEDLLNQRVSIFGCPQLSFRVGDFFTLKDGEIQSKNNVSVLAWMIKEQKLKTDTEKLIFKDPFVFANGVKREDGETGKQLDDAAQQQTGNPESEVIPVTQTPKNTSKPKKEKVAKQPVAEAGFNLQDKDLWSTVDNPMLARRGLSMPATEEELNAVRELLNNTEAAKKHNGIRDRVLIRATEKVDLDLVESKFNGILKKFLDLYNKLYPQNAVKLENVKIGGVEKQNLKTFWALKRGFVILDIYGDGTASVVVKNNNSSRLSPVTGVFSTSGGSGTVDINKARKWLSDTLGIDPDNIILSNAIFRSVDNLPVFAFTNLVLDRILEELVGVMKISAHADSGVEYHEAWHYVNLLLHDKETRARLYRAYVKSHKNIDWKGKTWGDVEEMMADDFKVFMEGFDDHSIIGRIKLAFNNIKDFVTASRNKKLYKQVFKDIRSKKYARMRLDQESAKEFLNAYKKYGVTKIAHHIPNMSKKDLEEMKLFDRYLDLLDGLDSVMNDVFFNIDLSSPKKMTELATEHFDYILEQIDKMIADQTDEEKVEKLKEIRNHPNIVRKAFIDEMLDFGVIAKVKKLKGVEEQTLTEIKEGATEAEDNPDNVWDKIVLKFLRKDNASIRTKMFLRTIPKSIKILNSKNKYDYILDTDDFGAPKTWDKDEAWRLILDTFWECDSFSEMITDKKGESHYSPSSILGIAEQNLDVSPFFYELFKKLKQLDYEGEYGDMLLKSQILSTVNSHKNQIQLIKIQDPKQHVSDDPFMGLDFTLSEEEFDSILDDDNGIVADRDRQWILSDDSLVSVARNVPRQWSKNLVINGMATYNEKTNTTVIEENFANKMYSALEEIRNAIKPYVLGKDEVLSKEKANKAADDLDKIKTKIVLFYRDLGILSDRQSLNVYIALRSKIQGDASVLQEFATLDKLFNTSKVGSVPFVVETLKQNIGKDKTSHEGATYEKAIDEAFSNYAADSDIGLLAVAWNAIHPSTFEFSVKDANGNRLYPINMNSYLSDRIRLLNKKRSALATKLKKSKYCQHSMVLEASEDVDPKDPKTKIKLTTFVGIRDATNVKGGDYFGITPMEDFLSKIMFTEKDQLICPIMADKKSWHTIYGKNIKLSHDVMLCAPLDKDLNKSIYDAYSQIDPYDLEKHVSKTDWNNLARKWYRELDKNDSTRIQIERSSIEALQARNTNMGFSIDPLTGNLIPRFSTTTLNRFAGYFLDEINCLIDYYSKANVKKIVSDKNARIENFHGVVKDGRMDFSGNGGRFRYFYDVVLPGQNENLNHTLQALFEILKKLEAGKVKDVTKKEGDIFKYVGTSVLKSKNLDGFELIREYLENIKKQMFSPTGDGKADLLIAINKKLVDTTYDQLDGISKDGSPIKLAKYDSARNRYIPTGIPAQFLKPYVEEFQKLELGMYGDPYEATDLMHHALFSLIANYTVNTATSIIEFEKVFSGDPAFYKNKPLAKSQRLNTKKDLPKKGKADVSYIVSDTEEIYKWSDQGWYKVEIPEDAGLSQVTIARTFDDGSVLNERVVVENMDDVFSDKIKRLGGLLSPGDELRLDFNDDELRFDPTLKSTVYTNLNVEDINIPSDFLDEVKDMFKRLLVVDMIRSKTTMTKSGEVSIQAFEDFFVKAKEQRIAENEKLKKEGHKQKPELTREGAIDMIYSSDTHFNSVYLNMTEEEKQEIDKSLAKQIKPYETVKEVANALVFIRPALYRKIRISLGDWTFDPDENGYCDEDAYNIIEGITVNLDGSRTKSENPSGDWMHDPKIYKYVKRLQLYPLKMSYFQNDSEQISGDVHINRPIYNKMAIFPLFAFHRATSVGKQLYDRMNKSGNEIDMITFKSAVKTGAIQKGPQVVTGNSLTDLSDELMQDNNVSIDYTTGKLKRNNKKNTLGVTVQDLSNLRMLLNTKAHEATVRAIGTQMFKIAFSNIIDDAWYGTNKKGRGARKGEQIKKDIIRCINLLTKIGVENLKARFYKDGRINDKEVENFVKSVIKNNGLGTSAEDIIYNGGIAASLVNRTVFENSATAIVNDEVVDIKTNGGTAVLQSVFGFTGYGSENVGVFSSNNGRELKWSALEGSMLVMLSLNFFKPVIPSDIYTDYNAARQWLIDHNIIGDNAKPYGIGYRIPTQGMSSMFAFQVADVLPEQQGDLIVVPREFVAQTGSDFDVDKIFLATFSYKNGVLETATDEDIKNWNKKPKTKKTEQSENLSEDEDDDDNLSGAIQNRLLLNYIDIISDKRNYANARASIDVITDSIHNDLLDPVLRKRRRGYIPGMWQLTPLFLAYRKMDFSTGKDGIGAFALNITNLALTLYTHLTIDFGKVGEEYGFGALDKIYGRDRLRISDWLSAMVNANVDVAKDPYVFDLNIVPATYNHANLLLRAGMGLSTFTFLAQPILKLLSGALNNAGGLYGDNIDGNNVDAETNNARRERIANMLMSSYGKMLTEIAGKYDISDKLLHKIDLANTLVKWHLLRKSSKKKKEEAGVDTSNPPINRAIIFNEKLGKDSIKSFKRLDEITENNVVDAVNSIIFQIHCLAAFMEIDKYARDLSQLVKISRIDTKKFGNTISQNIHFTNGYDSFRLKNSSFTINDPEWIKSVKPSNPDRGVSKEDISKAAIDKYLKDLYLDRKLRMATKYIKQILSHQLFVATDLYESIFKNVLMLIGDSERRIDVDGSLNIGYKGVFRDEDVKRISEGIDSVIRFNSLMSYGYDIYTNEIKNHEDSDMIDFTMGGDITAVVDKYRSLVEGENSIFNRLSAFMTKIRKNPSSEEADNLVDYNGDIINDLLLYLSPVSPDENHPIGRMILSHSQTDNKKSEETRLISAFAQLLSHPSKEVRELAKDIAIYAYYSTFDTNSANSFLHLVPYEYRKLYDMALKKSIKMLNSKSEKMRVRGMNAIQRTEYVGKDEDVAEMLAATSIIDILSRNYWYSNSIVPLHKLSKHMTNRGFQSSPYEDEEFIGSGVYDTDSDKMFPTFIATTRRSSEFFKIRKGPTTYLYRRVGKVLRKYESKTAKEEYDNYKALVDAGKAPESDNTTAKLAHLESKIEREASTYYIYIAIPKAGISKPGLNAVELYADYETPSIFTQNKLDSNFAEDNVRKEVQEYIGGEDLYYKLNLIWDRELIPEMYVSSNTNTYYKDDTFGTILNNPEKRTLGGAVILAKKSPEYAGQYHADVTINIVQSPLPKDAERKNIVKLRNDKENNVVDLSLNKTDFDSVVKRIKSIKDSKVVIHLSTSIFDSAWDVSDDEILKYINEQIDQYRSTYEGLVEDLETFVEEKRKALEISKTVKLEITQNKINDLVHELTLRLITAGVTIDKFSAGYNDGKTILPNTVMFENATDGQSFSSDKMSIYIQKDLTTKTKKFNKILSKLDSVDGSETSHIDQENREDTTIEIPAKTVQSDEVNLKPKNKLSAGFDSNIDYDLESDTSSNDFIEPLDDKPASKIVDLAKKAEENEEERKNTECGSTGGSGKSKNKLSKGSDTELDFDIDFFV